MDFVFSIADLINYLFIAAGIGVCTLCVLQISRSSHIRVDARKYFQIFFSLILLYITAHLARDLMDGRGGAGIKVALNIITFVEVLTAGIMTHIMSLLVAYVCRMDKKAMKRVVVLLYAILVLHALILVVDLPTHFVYFFDETNVYHRGNLYLLSNLCPVLMMLVDVVLLIRYRKNPDKRIYIAFWIYIAAPVLAIILQSFSKDVQFIIFATVGASVNMFSVIIARQNEQYEKQQMESSRLEAELNMASSIQADMLPNIFPAFPDRTEFDIYATMDPAKEVGGDFYDFFLVDDDHLCVVIADVSGKGVPAALFMMATKIILSNHAMTGKSPAKILSDANAAICSNNREEMFITVWLGILEISTGTLTFANAGHEDPVVYSSNEGFALIKEKHGFVMGGMDGVNYKESSIQLHKGAKVFLYTDGVPEATNAEKQLFGVDRMIEALNENVKASPEQILKNVRAAVDGFVRDAEQFDDLTMVCIEYKGV